MIILASPTPGIYKPFNMFKDFRNTGQGKIFRNLSKITQSPIAIYNIYICSK